MGIVYWVFCITHLYNEVCQSQPATQSHNFEKLSERYIYMITEFVHLTIWKLDNSVII
jgi:hypothetical protein